MKKTLHLTCFLLALALLYVYLTTPRQSPTYLSPNKQLSPNTVEKDHEFVAVIKEMNERNDKIKNLICQDVEIKMKAELSVKLTAALAFEREKRFRMGVESIIGKEMDLGSNDTHFWFWSRRMNPPALHYARHENVDKTLLKTPLNPNWMLECLGVIPVQYQNVNIAKIGDKWAVIEERTSNGLPVTKITLIDRENKRIVGHYLYDHLGKMEASAEIVSFQDIDGHPIPTNMVITWYSEKIRMEWTVNDPRINVPLDTKNWEMPHMKEMIDMAND